MQNFLVTGTDTDAGKTYVSSLLIRLMRQQGIDVVGFKPMACGSREDPLALRAASGLENLTLDRINPVFLKNATSPYVAARLENTEVNLESIQVAYERLKEEHDYVLVEGVGGWEVPIAPHYLFSDFATEMQLPVVLVIGNKLGVLNHAILSLHAIQARGLCCAGVIINNMSDEWDTASVTNRGILEEFIDVPVLGELIHGQDYLDLDPLLEALK
jgi:dethiobiotin synthetase